MPGRDLNLLSLDGGGVRGLSSLQILKQLMERVRIESHLDTPPKPCDYFDMIGGTSTGGLIAIMLGRLKMTVDECINAYADLSDEVFQKKHHRVNIRGGGIQGRFDSSALERAVKEIIVSKGFDEDELLFDKHDGACKVFVCATNKRTTEIVHITSYRRSRGGEDRLRAIKIWEAARATSAASSFFDPISINLGTYKEDFLDGATGANNPVYELWNEAKDTWDPEPILSNLKSVISIGTGVPSVEPFRTGLFEIGETLVRISTETEQTAESFQRSHSELDDSGGYFRFNVRNGLEHIGLEDSSQRGDIMTLTERYVESQDVFKLMKLCGKCLAERELSSGDVLSDIHTSLTLRNDLPLQKQGIRESWRDIFPKISKYDHEKVHRQFRRKRLLNTANWFVDHASFRTWLDGPDSCFLWCTGNVGSGKTIITTAVIDAAKVKRLKNEYSLAYFYCESTPRNVQQAAVLFESLIKQGLMYLVETQKICPDPISVRIEELYRYGGAERDFEDIVDIFSCLFNYFDRAIYIIDGLDELRDEERILVLNVFRDLFKQPGQQKLFISSRTEPHHNITMIHIIPNTKRIHVEQEKLGDIKHYIEIRIAEKRRINRELTNDPCLIEDIKFRLLSGAKGMFLWVQLQIEALWDLCFTDNDIKNELENLPKDLRSTYQRCLQRIERNNHSDHARKVFKWVGCTSRSLHIDELKEAIAFTLEDRKWEAGRTQSSRRIIERCANLVILDEFDQHVRFVHPSVQQYLLESRDHIHAFQIDRDKGQLECGEFAINYLNFSDFGLQLSKDRSKSVALPSAVASPVIASTGGLGKMTSKFTSLLLPGSTRTLPVRYFHLPAVASIVPTPDAAKYKFLPYAIENWAIDSKFITKNSQQWPNFTSLAIQPNTTWKLHPWQSGGQSHSSHLHGLLGWAVRNEHMPLLELLFDSRSVYDLHEFYDKPLIKDGLPALHVASRLGYKNTVTQLLKVSGVNDLDYQQRTALHYAAEKGHVEVVEMLLKAKGAKVNVADKICSDTPLLLSAKQGHTAIVQFLVKMKARVETTDNVGRTALYSAAENGHDAVVKALIVHGAKAETANEEGITALYRAAENGHAAAVKTLVAVGAKAETADENGITALHRAAANGHAAVVKTLIGGGTMAETADKRGYTALYRAAENGHAETVKLLMQERVIIDSAVERGITALYRAAENGHAETVRLLINGGARKETADKRGITALNRAAENGHAETVKLLIEGGAIIERADNRGITALYRAAENGHVKTVELLIKEGAMVKMTDEEKLTVLYQAAENGHEAVVKTLITGGAIAETTDKWMTALCQAAENGYEMAVKTLIVGGIMVKTIGGETGDADSKDQNYDRTLLSWAAENGHEIVFKLLADRKEIDADSKGIWNRTPLSIAAENGHENVVKLLINRNDVNADSKDYLNRTPLSYAAENGHENVAKLLMEQKGVNFNLKDIWNRTPLSWAAENGHENVIELLVQERALDADSKDVHCDRTPLSWAAKNGHENVTIFLLMKLPDINADSKDHWDRTPMSYAAENGDENVVIRLLEKGVNADSKDYLNRTPLSYAAENGRKNMVPWLLRKGANAHSIDNSGQTPLSYASTNGHSAISKMLQDSPP